MEDQANYIVLHPDETRGFGSGASSYIPTFGAPTTVVDQYRVVGIASSNLPTLGVAFTDVNAVVAISKIAEGGITNVAELEAAEAALQALLLHNIVHVLLPCPKGRLENNFVTYLRRDGRLRTQFGFDLFATAKSRDWLIVPEFFHASDDTVTASNIPNSSLLGLKLDQIRNETDYWNDDVAEAINVAVEAHAVPAYFTDPRLMRTRRGDGFQKRFYHRLRLSWDKAVGEIPPIVCTFSLPPLLAIVLERLNNRADLHRAIMELRDELVPVRNELGEFNKLITRSMASAEIESRIKRIQESFDAIVPESRLSQAQRRKRRILSIQGLVQPLVKFAMGYASKGGASVEDGIKAAGGLRDYVIESGLFVDRTITAQTFAGLMKTEALQSLVKHHFSEAEVAAMERSIRAQRR